MNNEASYDNGLICGGTLEIFVEPILPQPVAYIFGGGHISIALAKSASAAGFAIGVIDDREQFANKDRFPMAQEILHQLRKAFEQIQPNVSSYLIIVTRGHRDDMRVLAWAVRTSAKYIGMIGSSAKFSPCTRLLKKKAIRLKSSPACSLRWVSKLARYRRKKSPCSITAELIAVRRNAQSAQHKKLQREIHEAVASVSRGSR